MIRFRLFAAFAFLGGCVDPLEPRDRPPSNIELQPACAAARGTQHTSLQPGSHRFRPSGNPHWVMQTLRVEGGTLTNEAGTTVCFAAATELQIADSARVEVYGTQSAPVLLTAMDPVQQWGGIQQAGINGPTGAHLTLVNAWLEHALEGVAVLSFIVDSTVIQQIRGRAIRGNIYYMEHFLNRRGNGRITNSRVDSACAACVASAAAIETGNYALLIEQTAIRGSGGHGVGVYGGTLSLYDRAHRRQRANRSCHALCESIPRSVPHRAGIRDAAGFSAHHGGRKLSRRASGCAGQPVDAGRRGRCPRDGKCERRAAVVGRDRR
jgi:hypothetical protein